MFNHNLQHINLITSFCRWFYQAQANKKTTQTLSGLFFYSEQVYKPGSVLNSHLSWYTVASIIVRPLPETGRAAPFCFSIRSCFRWGLHSLLRYRRSGGLLPHLSILTCYQAVYLCCTILRVASTGR